MTGTPRCTCQIDAHDFACPIHGEMCLSCGGSGFTSDADGVEHNCYSCETTGRKSMESPMGKPIETPHSPAPTEADICRLEKVAWDANVEHVVIWYRDQIAQLRERVRETEQALKLADDQRRREWQHAAQVVDYYTGRDLDQMNEEYGTERLRQ